MQTQKRYNSWCIHIFLIVSLFNGSYASENTPEKPGYWQRFKSGAQSTAEAVKGAGIIGVATATGAYYGTTVLGTLTHELGHAVIGAALGLKPTKIKLGLHEGYVEFSDVRPDIMDYPTKIIRRKFLPTLIAGPTAGIYFNYAMLHALAEKESERKQSLKEQFTQHPATVGATAAAGIHLLRNMLSTTIYRGDGQDIFQSIVTPMQRNNYRFLANVAGSAYITTSLLGVVGTAWWLKNHFYKQWGFEKSPVAQQHTAIESIKPREQ